MAQFLLSIIQPVGPAPAADFLEPIMRDVETLNREMMDAGVWVFGAGLDPTDTAAVVRPKGAELVITDGPYAKAQEHLGGFTVVEAADFGAALGWAEKLARATTLPVEVRAVQQ